MTLNCREVDELVAPLVLNALVAGERLDVLEHIAECRLHDAELEAFRETVALLPTAVETASSPPMALRGSLLAAFEAEERGSETPVSILEAKRAKRSFWRIPAFAYGVAAALVLIVVGLAAWNVSLRTEGSSAAVVASAQYDGMNLKVVYLPSDELAVVDMSMPALPTNQTYQAWQITDSGPVSLGVMPNSTTQVLKINLSQASAIAISVEPAGGSLTPTRPVLSASLRD